MRIMWLKIATIVILLGASYAFYMFSSSDIKFDVPQAISFDDIKEEVVEVTDATVARVISEPEVESVGLMDVEPIVSYDELPEEINLAVPFTSQAPFANWDEVHEDTCEEASVLMVHAFYEGEVKGQIDPGIAEDVLQDMVESETMIFGSFEDTTAEQTAEFAKIYYGYERVDVLENPSVDELKFHLSEGRPIIIPAAGRILDNPFFSGTGPIYHMLVLKGYSEGGFITNDPGTRRGADWVYEFEHLMSSIHDWVVPEGIEDTPDKIESSSRKAIVIYPN